MEGASLTITNAEGLKLAATFVDAGSPDVVILCHGYAGSKDGFVWPALAAELAGGHGRSSLRFDFAGNGQSEGEFTFGGYGREAEDLRCVVQYVQQQLGRSVSAIVGHSKGGNVVLLYAAKYDDVPYVVNVSGRAVMSRGVKERFGSDILERLQREGGVEQQVRGDGGRMITYQLTHQAVSERMALDMLAEAAKIQRSRVLTVHCTADKVIPVEDAQLLAQRIRHHTLLVVEGGDHSFRAAGAAEQLIARTVEFITTGA